MRAKEEQKRKMEEAKVRLAVHHVRKDRAHSLSDLQRQREEQAAIPPQQMFLNQTDKYSAFDEQGELHTNCQRLCP